EDAGRGERGGLADRHDARVRVVRPHERGVALIRQGDVVGVLPLADEKALVLLAPDGGAHAIGNAHCCTAFSLRLAGPGRSAAPRSRGALMLASARRLMCPPPRPSPP